MKELTPIRKKEIITSLFQTFQWKEFVDVFLNGEKNVKMKELKSSRGSIEDMNYILGYIECIDKLIDYERMVKEVDFYIKLEKSHESEK